MCSFVYQICPNIWLIMSIKSFEVTELSSNLCFNFKIQSMIMLVSVMIMMEAHTTHTWHHALPWCMLFIKSYFLCLSKVWTIHYVFTWWCPCKMLVLLTITRVVVWGVELGHCVEHLLSFTIARPDNTSGQSASTITGTGRNLTTQLSQVPMTQCLSMYRRVTSSLQVQVPV